MKGASKVIMGATVVMVVGLGFVLTLVLILLAELYCNLILRRRQQRQQLAVSSPDAATPNTTIPSSPPSNLLHNNRHPSSSPSPPPPALGVLQAPRSFLFPAVKEAKRLINSRRSNHHESRHQLHHVLELYDDSSNAALAASPTPPPPASYLSSPQEIREVPALIRHPDQNKESPKTAEHFIYISNPIYDNRPPPSAATGTDNNNKGADPGDSDGTPFETPDSSPSRLESGDVSSSDEEITTMTKSSPPAGSNTPPLLPMKKLPAEATSVPMRDARSLGTVSGSTDSNSNNGLLSSSSSRGSPSTSPSW